eukprot:m.41985 g.41985  ORF g.41985 m.41985 type:complete len:355 (-) comp12845_c0_seq1:111-1175(-)
MSDVPMAVSELLEQAKTLHQQDKLMQAYKCIEKARAIFKQANIADDSIEGLSNAPSATDDEAAAPNEQPLDALTTIVVEDQQLQHITATAEDVEHLLNELASDAGWQLQRQDQQTTTYFKPGHDDNPFVTVRVEGWVDQPLKYILAALYECDYHPEWFPSAFSLGIARSEVLHELKLTKLWTHQHVRLPWPFTDRKMDLLVNGIDCMDVEEPVRRVIIQLKSISSEEDVADLNQAYDRNDLEMPDLDAGAIAIELLRGAFVLTPSSINPSITDHSGTFVQFVASIDAKFDSLPTCAINIGVKKVAHWLVESLAKQAALIPTDERYLQRMEGEHREFYEYIAARMVECGLPAEER